MNIDVKQVMRELLLSPLAWASYFAWVAVWLTAMAVVDRHPGGLPTLADLLLFAFLLCWMACLLDELIPRCVYDAFLVALTLLTALALWFIPSGSTPILLILLATQFTNRLSPVFLVLALVAVNLYFGAVMIESWGSSWRNAGLSMLGFAGFQLFAVLVMRYANAAERMAEDLKAVNARLLATRSLLSETARDQERLRLSRELHDVAGHKLTALKLKLRGLARRLDDDAAREVEDATGLADELLQDLRSVVRHLRETEGIDLAESLREVARPLPRPRLELHLDEHARVPRADQAEALLRTFQEALTNAARHGPARTLHVRLDRRGEQLVLTAEDDGDYPDEVRPGNGLTGMRERLAELNGSLEISRSELGGVKLVATLPVELT
ncbi:sensor histidine kinase [Wenzhouxiangella sp. EGI_FJ10409]|uniref:sensor histidine kinase n=1 Tax=Wenzhouxiangella sp. EGI_FJ10409 TaxID=3243767 RepID=UPI0035DBB54D